MNRVLSSNQKLTSFSLEGDIKMADSAINVCRVSQISTIAQLVHCDFLVTVQITPLDYWDYHAEISDTIHNNPH